MVSPERFELSTNSLKGYCSTVELQAHVTSCYSIKLALLRQPNTQEEILF